MDKQQVIQSVRKLIGEAEVEKALGQLIAFLETDNRFDELNRTAIQALSQLQKTKKDEATGIISFDNAKLSYNQVINQILLILDRLEAGKTTMVDGQIPQSRRAITIIGAILLVGLVGMFVWRTVHKKNRIGEKIQVAQTCPDYNKNSIFNILLFRFQSFGGKQLDAHLAVLDRLGRLTDDYNIPADVGLYDDKNDNKNLPASLKQAEKIGQGCNAKLVVMGTEEAGSQGDIITTRYRFLDLGDQFAFRQLKVNDRTEIDTVTSISSITTNGVLTGNLEQMIFLLFGVVAHETHHDKAAIEMLTKAEPTDSASSLLKGMTLADSYLAMDEPEKALKSYDEVLQEHPNYSFALKNRAALYTAKGEYMDATRDLSVHLESHPDDADALKERGTIFLKAEQLDKAKKDLNQAKEIKPTDTSVLRSLKLLDAKIEEQKKIKENADKTLEQRPGDLNALNEKATASKNLGDYRTAVQTAESVLKQDPKNPQAYSTLVEAFTELKQPEKVKEVLQRIKRTNINPEILKRTSPTFNMMIQKDTAVLQKKQ